MQVNKIKNWGGGGSVVYKKYSAWLEINRDDK